MAKVILRNNREHDRGYRPYTLTTDSNGTILDSYFGDILVLPMIDNSGYAIGIGKNVQITTPIGAIRTAQTNRRKDNSELTMLVYNLSVKAGKRVAKMHGDFTFVDETSEPTPVWPNGI